MNGAPPASCTLAWSLTDCGTSGFWSIPARKDVASAATSTEPASAVPSDAPSWVAVFCSPPTSELFSSGTAETVTAPSCDASAPMPRPMMSSGTNTIDESAPDLEAGDESHDAGDEGQQADAHHPARVGLRAKARDADRGDQKRQRERQQADAGLHRRHAEHHREEQRHDEEHAGLDEEQEEECDQAAGELRDLQQRGRDERLLAECAPCGAAT